MPFIGHVTKIERPARISYDDDERAPDVSWTCLFTQDLTLYFLGNTECHVLLANFFAERSTNSFLFKWNHAL